METVLAALVAAVPATIASLASWNNSKKTRAEVSTNHGKRAGEYIELTHAGMELAKDEICALRKAFARHEVDDERRFAQIEDLLN